MSEAAGMLLARIVEPVIGERDFEVRSGIALPGGVVRTVPNLSERGVWSRSKSDSHRAGMVRDLARTGHIEARRPTSRSKSNSGIARTASVPTFAW